ncbi:pitrilysin family protein [Falsirhodobacter sp. alg1]|uniref:M16 family metallopeptidase n=1 Tax=Falsirhodobacter sp. alg1 TaxID=1472418 RepID=UPI0005F0C61C|nr:pitrilysin family protein [Falsirhodobacter sp. alg1]
MKILKTAIALICLSLPAYAAVPIQKVTSPGGITAWLVEEHDIPFTALEIEFRGGTSLDAEGKRGATNLMAAMLEEGTGDMDAQAFAAARDTLAADIDFSSNKDMVSVSARFLTENRDQGADLLHSALVAPSFNESAITRIKAQIISGIRSSNQDPEHIARQAMASLVFGNHPYGSDDSGTEESVAALTADDLRDAHAAALARDRVYVAASGDITPEDLGKLLDRVLGDLPATGAPMPADTTLDDKGSTTVVDFPTPQSVVSFLQPGLDVQDPDFMAAYVVSEIVGGSRFTARLMDELRSKRGLTYGAYSNMVTMDHANFMSGHFASDNDKVAEAVQVTRDVWADVAENGVTQEELDAAKTYMTGAYPLRFDGNGPIASILVGMQVQGFDIDYPKTRNQLINALTLEDVNRVAKKLYNPDALRFVIAGQPEGMDQN